MKKKLRIPIAITIASCLVLIGCSSTETEQQETNKINKVVQKSLTQKPEGDTSLNLKNKDSKIQVYLVVNSTDEQDLLNLKNNGVEIEIVNNKLKKIQAWIDQGKLEQIQALDNVITITSPSYGQTHHRTKK